MADMTDEELGAAIYKRANEMLADKMCATVFLFPDTQTHIGAAARALLTKPAPTREAVLEHRRKWWREQTTLGGHANVDWALAALSHFAAPDMPKMMIEGMTVDEIIREMEPWANHVTFVIGKDDAARVAHRLANTPAPVVDEDAGPREMCDTWANLQNAKPGPLRDFVPTFDGGNDEWKARWRQHYAWVLSGFPKEPEWARSSQGGGR